MSSCIFLPVQISGGTDIEVAALEAAALANRIGVWVQFKFNDVACHVAPGCAPEDLVEAWENALKGTGRHKMAFARQGGNHRYADSAPAEPK